jgi:CRISPR/Cas system CMR subunit Cmr4 (Cas7 group RAMP superfamily)
MRESLKKYDLSVNFLGYWFIGTGSEAGAYSDLLTQRDPRGFPYVPGKSLKGVFREAFRQAGRSGWFDRFNHTGDGRFDFLEKLIQMIFGHDGTKEGFLEDELHAEGLIHFSNAEFPECIKDRICEGTHDQKGEYKSKGDRTEMLFTTVQSTKIDRDTGTASEKSLRTVEAVIPLHLHAEVTVDPLEKREDSGCILTEQDFAEIVGLFDAVAGLVTEIGGKRRRGFGRCLWNMKEE